MVSGSGSVRSGRFGLRDSDRKPTTLIFTSVFWHSESQNETDKGDNVKNQTERRAVSPCVLGVCKLHVSPAHILKHRLATFLQYPSVLFLSGYISSIFGWGFCPTHPASYHLEHSPGHRSVWIHGASQFFSRRLECLVNSRCVRSSPWPLSCSVPNDSGEGPNSAVRVQFQGLVLDPAPMHLIITP